MTHEGHKSRLREKARAILSDLPEHEVLELLLNYCIVRKNTNSIAHDLLSKFGSLAGVLDAPYDSLKQVEGMGEVSATFLNLLPSIFSYYNRSGLKGRKTLSNVQQCVEYAQTYLNMCKSEKLLVVCLDKRFNILLSFDLSDNQSDIISFKLADVLAKITSAKSSRVLVAHNHIFGSVKPSSEDIMFTKKLVVALNSVGIEFVDHIIVSNNDEYFSFRASEILE